MDSVHGDRHRVVEELGPSQCYFRFLGKKPVLQDGGLSNGQRQNFETQY